MKYSLCILAMLAGCNDNTLSVLDTTIRDNLPYYCDKGEKAHLAFTLGDAFTTGLVPHKVREDEAKSYVTLRYLCQGDLSKVTTFDIALRAYQAYVAIDAAKREAASL